MYENLRISPTVTLTMSILGWVSINVLIGNHGVDFYEDVIILVRIAAAKIMCNRIGGKGS